METIDPTLNYCPACNDEYRADFSKCAGCGVELVSGADLLAERRENEDTEQPPSQIDSSDALIIIQSGSLLEMKMLKKRLEEATIPAILVKDQSCRGGCCGPEIYVQIRQEDQEKAAVFLRKEYEKTTAITDYATVKADAVFNPAASRVVCPACNHEFVPNGAGCPDCGLQFT